MSRAARVLICILSLAASTGRVLSADSPRSRITISLRALSARNALERLFHDSGQQYRLEVKEVEGQVTLDASDVPFDSALRLVLSQVRPRLTYRRDDGVYVLRQEGNSPVTKPEAAPAVTTHTETTREGVLTGSSAFDRALDANVRAVMPHPGEARWLEVPWRKDVNQARLEAIQTGKPILLWVSGGDPTSTC